MLIEFLHSFDLFCYKTLEKGFISWKIFNWSKSGNWGFKGENQDSSSWEAYLWRWILVVLQTKFFMFSHQKKITGIENTVSENWMLWKKIKWDLERRIQARGFVIKPCFKLIKRRNWKNISGCSMYQRSDALFSSRFFWCNPLEHSIEVPLEEVKTLDLRHLGSKTNE